MNRGNDGRQADGIGESNPIRSDGDALRPLDAQAQRIPNGFDRALDDLVRWGMVYGRWEWRQDEDGDIVWEEVFREVSFKKEFPPTGIHASSTPPRREGRQ